MPGPELTSETIVPFIVDLFERRGADSYLGEAVTMSEHMLQGARLAEQEGAGDELVAAALLHDIGHYTGEFGDDYIDQGIDNHHDAAGAQVLAPFFPAVVSECARLHVAAKRYLCATDPGYFATLSPASVRTLGFQGGPMQAEEIGAFEANPYHAAAVRVRRWDEASKVPDTPTRAIRDYADLLQRVVDQRMDRDQSDRAT
ncbi:MAG TPA: HD domain-containing protein [Acetobacteraceae bacterium]|nr:HD domain-containing protein [Acetobacteraceae bacterium]